MNFQMILNKLNKLFFLALFAIVCVACNGAGSTSTATNDTASMFPTSLAVSSPLSSTTTSASTTSSSLKYSTTSDIVPTYQHITDEIATLLSGSAACSFNPEDFLQQDEDAECYGPEVSYDEHPDATSSADTAGTLPVGDLGLWVETDPASGNACAASQLDARMTGMEAKTSAALSGLATMLCVANANGVVLPDASSPGSVSVLPEMIALSITDTTINVATVTYVVSTGNYTYELDFDYTPGTDLYNVYVDMEHASTTDPAIYSGDLSILVNERFSGAYGTNCPSTDITHNTSVQYNMLSSTEAQMEVRSGEFCGHNADGRDGNGIIDPSLKYSATTPNGWGNNFAIFTANFDPSDLDGHYAYSWQAGHFDGNTRVLNLTVENSGVDAFAYFGYGDDVETTNGQVAGFICNWTGPNNDHTIIEYAQFQDMTVDAYGVVNSVTANIEYAPTVSCEYDGTGAFIFDTDADTLLSDEDPTIAIVNDLEAGDELDGDGIPTIEEVIEFEGFILPTM
ncbi:MAG: hypothetical protein ABII18_07455 [bacterium]|nr:hypothetical protein [bacterium]